MRRKDFRNARVECVRMRAGKTYERREKSERGENKPPNESTSHGVTLRRREPQDARRDADDARRQSPPFSSRRRRIECFPYLDASFITRPFKGALVCPSESASTSHRIELPRVIT